MAEVKLKALNVVCSLPDDDLYSREDMIENMIEIVQMLETLEQVEMD